MFAVTADRAVFHLDGPVVILIGIVCGLAEAGHGFDANGVAFDEFVATAFLAVVRNLGGFVHAGADAVSDVILNDTEVTFFQNLFDSVTNVADVGTGFDFVDSFPHGGFGDGNHFLDGGTTLTADEHGKSGVGEIAVVIDVEVEGYFVANF